MCAFFVLIDPNNVSVCVGCCKKLDAHVEGCTKFLPSLPYMLLLHILEGVAIVFLALLAHSRAMPPKKLRLRCWPGVTQSQVMEVLKQWVSTQKIGSLVVGFQEPHIQNALSICPIFWSKIFTCSLGKPPLCSCVFDLGLIKSGWIPGA